MKKMTYNIVDGSESFITKLLYKENKIKHLLYITKNYTNIENTVKNMKFFIPNVKVLAFPPWDCQPYDNTSPSIKTIYQRINTLYEINNNNNDNIVIITTEDSIIQKIPPKNFITENIINLYINKNIQQELLINQLIEMGYERTYTSTEIGEFAVRGSIMDIILYNSSIRIDFLDNTIESIKEFNSETQISSNNINCILIKPITEAILKDTFIDDFKRRYNDIVNYKNNNITLNILLNHKKIIGYEHLLPLFYNKLYTIFDYLQNPYIIYENNTKNILFNTYNKLLDKFNNSEEDTLFSDKSNIKLHPKYLYLTPNEIDNINNTYNSIYLTTMPENPLLSIHLAPIIITKQQKLNPEILIRSFKNNKQSILISCKSTGIQHLIIQILEHYNFTYKYIISIDEIKNNNIIYLCNTNINYSFETDKFIFITSQDLVKKDITNNYNTQKINKIINDINIFQKNDLVIHREYGIGRFEDIETQSIHNIQYDLLKIIYKNNNILYIPVQNINLLSRYDIQTSNIELDKLGSVSWQNRKANINKKIEEIAHKILETAASRKKAKGIVINIKQDEYTAFCKRFPYVETEDQLKSIKDIENDLTEGNVINRLICGDVGFGKTEIAIRATFLLAHNNYQVAIITPTTLLCRQHFIVFSERFKDLPFNIHKISSGTTSNNRKEILTNINNGTIDIIIGTHSLLSQNIKFNNLGLVIIDEEQHFGVSQKELFKQLYTNINLIKLSATPIPRTLQMAMTQIFDINLITTPPFNKLPVRIKIISNDYMLIKEIIQKELSRNGQIFYICPKIIDLNKIADILTKILPDLSFTIAHGQLHKSQLNRIMNNFYNNNIDLLLTTTIIESGIDVSNANTMIVHNSDMLGLSQLYQLKGRIGRGNRQGYCYFAVHKDRTINDKAKKRLKILASLDNKIATNFNIASYDLEIRGYGNLLGKEQSGQIKEVGIELYNKMLQETLNNISNNTISTFEPEIKINIPIQIPKTYIKEFELKLNIYKQISELKSKQEINEMQINLVDRFGTLPPEVKIY